MYHSQNADKGPGKDNRSEDPKDCPYHYMFATVVVLGPGARSMVSVSVSGLKCPPHLSFSRVMRYRQEACILGHILV